MGFTPYKNGQRVLVVFEPEPISKHYVPNTGQGCAMIRCRITNITDMHKKFYEDFDK